MAQWTDLHIQLHGAGYCLYQEFHAYDHAIRTKALTDLYTMCDKVHWEGSAESVKAQSGMSRPVSRKPVYTMISLVILGCHRLVFKIETSNHVKLGYLNLAI